MEAKRSFNVNKLNVSVFPTRDLMGKACAREAGEIIRSLLAEKEYVSIIFASAPSQMEMLNALINEKGIEWDRVKAFHMDEYIGLPADAPQSFGNYLKIRLFTKLPFKSVFYMDGNAPDIEGECERYSKLLRDNPPDISFLGIGENGHIAFNDPHIADFEDPLPVKINSHLDFTCRQQQVNDVWFKSLEDVPSQAITITITGLMKAQYIFTTVPGKTKQNIIKKCIEGPISIECPATIIRTHDKSRLFLDDDSAALLDFSVL
ncbi:MAG TPA: glucosamine-6-phosphate deaminase [Clostridia bacterium]|nr:glucosamine-6-phosphate deaminase [Clostridia bacterium]